MRRIRPLRLLAVALFPLGLVACSNHASPAYEVPVAVDQQTTAHVLNTNTYPVTVYLTQAGMRHRLGVVESSSAGLFVIPPRVLAGRRDFKLVASPLGPHPTAMSETFMIQPGQFASWRVQEPRTRELAAATLVSVR